MLTSHQQQRSVNSTEPISAFGDLRTTELHPLVEGSFEYTVSNTGLNMNTVVGTGTVSVKSANSATIDAELLWKELF